MRHGFGTALIFSMVLAGLPAMSADGASGEAAAGDIEAGQKRYKRECRQCHGPTAKGVSSYPKLLNHSAAYLTDKLQRYRAGEKIGPNTPLMAPRAKKLKDKDIADLAAFIVSLNEN